MSLGLDTVRELVAGYLEKCGLAAVTAWSGTDRSFGSVPVVSVSLRRCCAEQSGFANYLGEQWNEETACWEERYARKMNVTMGLDIYAPVSVGAEAVITVFDQMVEALSQWKSEGISVGDISCGETVYDEGERVLKRNVEAECGLYLYAVATAGETFLDFKVKGGLLT